MSPWKPPTGSVAMDTVYWIKRIEFVERYVRVHARSHYDLWTTRHHAAEAWEAL